MVREVEIPGPILTDDSGIVLTDDAGVELVASINVLLPIDQMLVKLTSWSAAAVLTSSRLRLGFRK